MELLKYKIKQDIMEEQKMLQMGGGIVATNLMLLGKIMAIITIIIIIIMEMDIIIIIMMDMVMEMAIVIVEVQVQVVMKIKIITIIMKTMMKTMMKRKWKILKMRLIGYLNY